MADQTPPPEDSSPQPAQTNEVVSHQPILVVAIVFIVLIALGTYLFTYKRNQGINIENGDLIFPSPSSIRVNLQNTYPTSIIDPSAIPPKHVILFRKVDKKEDPVFNLEVDAAPDILMAGPFVIWNTMNASQSAQVFVHNTSTGETKNIYDALKRNDFPYAGKTQRYAGNLIIINNNLYFSLGGYLTPGAVFYTDISFSEPVKKLTDIDNGKIQHMYNHYFVVGGEGDGCWGSATYKLLNEATKKITDIATLGNGCGGGETFIGVDKRDRFIIANNHDETNRTDPTDPTGNLPYKYVYALPLNNPTAKEGVIAQQYMPADIDRIFLKTDTNVLELQGKKNYTFNIDSGELKEDQQTLPTPTPQFSYDSPKVEDEIQSIKLPDNYRFEIK